MREKIQAILDIANVEMSKMCFDYSKGFGLALVGAYLTGKSSAAISAALIIGVIMMMFFGIYFLYRDNDRKEREKLDE